MVPCLHQSNVYIKRKLGVWRALKSIPLVGGKKPHLPVRDCKLHHLMYVSTRPRTEICGNPVLPFAMLPYLYQNEATGIESPKMHFSSRCKNRTYMCRTTNYPTHVSKHSAENGNLRKSGSTFRHGTVFVPKQCLYQKETTCMESPQMDSSSLCKNRTYLCWTAKYHVSQYRCKNGNLQKSGSTFRHGVVFAPMQCLYQKEATGMENPKLAFL